MDRRLREEAERLERRLPKTPGRKWQESKWGCHGGRKG